MASFGGGGATRPFPREGDAEVLRRDSSVESRPNVWTRDQRWKKSCHLGRLFISHKDSVFVSFPGNDTD